MARDVKTSQVYGQRNVDGQAASYVDQGFALVCNGSTPAAMSLALADQTQRICGLTVNNQSNCVVGVYVNRQPSGMPDFQVFGDTMVGHPIPSASYLYLAFAPPGGAVAAGTIYGHYTNQLVVASFATVPTGSVSAGVWDSSVWDVALFS